VLKLRGSRQEALALPIFPILFYPEYQTVRLDFRDNSPFPPRPLVSFSPASSGPLAFGSQVFASFFLPFSHLIFSFTVPRNRSHRFPSFHSYFRTI